ncbi:unnamed protein product [Trypanosoma congolense IL3000]|uniref:WGS project CAEQ00000000 data, annotated contig 1002 n=1 Tax=Trypanosoma congolense (strain IL3000) TaxID=1068625 RepID=F9W357_TRYCI|nr:unnamed protein product [Trypanosoma congolense IL3000]
MNLLCPFWINKIPRLRTDSPSALSLADLLYCNVEDPNEVWTHVILGGYVIDVEWLFRVSGPLLMSKCTIVLISGEKGFLHKYRHLVLHDRFGRNRVKIVEPCLPIPFGVHHSKMMLCINNNGIRVAVLTANFIEDDWNYKTQGIYFQDFPRLKTQSENIVLNISSIEGKGMRFRNEIKRYLSCIGVASSMPKDGCIPLSLLDEFDFSGACVELIASVPGYHRCSDAQHYGLGKLKSILQSMQLPSSLDRNPPVLTWQFTSQGLLTANFLNSMKQIMSIDARNPTGEDKMDPVVRVVYPTETEVKNSLEGWRGGLSLPVTLRCCHSYINERLFRWGTVPQGSEVENERSKGLPHLKTYTRLTESEDGLSWFLLTSANLSRAAWGEWQHGGTQLLIRSYELGVLYDETSFLHVKEDGLFSVTPSRPVPIPSSADGDGLVRVTIKADTCKKDGGGAALFLPYNPLTLQPYVSTVQIQERRTNALAERSKSPLSTTDVPWVVDVPHHGEDRFGKEFHDVLSGDNPCKEYLHASHRLSRSNSQIRKKRMKYDN